MSPEHDKAKKKFDQFIEESVLEAREEDRKANDGTKKAETAVASRNRNGQQARNGDGRIRSTHRCTDGSRVLLGRTALADCTFNKRVATLTLLVDGKASRELFGDVLRSEMKMAAADALKFHDKAIAARTAASTAADGGAAADTQTTAEPVKETYGETEGRRPGR